MLKEFQKEYCKPVSSPMEIGCKLYGYDESPHVDQKLFRSMIGSLLYITPSRQDITLVVTLVLRYQSAPK